MSERVDVFVEAKIAIAGRAYTVHRFDLDEPLDRVPRLVADLVDHDGALPRPADVLDKPVTFTLERSDGSQKRSFVGRVVAAEVGVEYHDMPTMHVEVAPRLFALEKRSTSRMFQDMTAIEIVKKVLADAGIPDKSQDYRTGEDHPKRVYTVQYRETDLELVQRLLFEEGITFAVHVLVVFDVHRKRDAF